MRSISRKQQLLQIVTGEANGWMTHVLLVLSQPAISAVQPTTSFTPMSLRLANCKVFEKSVSDTYLLQPDNEVI